MIKIALLHGAGINSGDFLILERSKALLKHFYPDCQINEFFRNVNLEDRLPEINNNDILIFSGGPGYINNFYPELALRFNDLNRIKIPIMFMGMGWFGYDANVTNLYGYQFNDKMKELLLRASHDTKTLGCRDYLSVNVLRNNGIDSGLMTGCPAWYDLSSVDKISYTGKPLTQAKKICISDCANPEYQKHALELTTFIRRFFGDAAEIYFIFHRGNSHYPPEFYNHLESLSISYQNIANSADGFSIYDDCDLHVGFRVHAHIYNLSKRNLSILIEEDARGAGVNEALGLPHIPAYIDAINNNSLIHLSNPSICYQVEDELINLSNNNYIRMDTAYFSMYKNFQSMKKHLQSISQYI